MRASVEASLKRLGTHYIDLYYLHSECVGVCLCWQVNLAVCVVCMLCECVCARLLNDLHRLLHRALIRVAHCTVCVFVCGQLGVPFVSHAV